MPLLYHKTVQDGMPQAITYAGPEILRNVNTGNWLARATFKIEKYPRVALFDVAGLACSLDNFSAMQDIAKQRGPLLRMREAAEYLGISERTLYTLLTKHPDWRFQITDKSVRIITAKLDQWIASQA